MMTQQIPPPGRMRIGPATGDLAAYGAPTAPADQPEVDGIEIIEVRSAEHLVEIAPVMRDFFAWRRDRDRTRAQQAGSQADAAEDQGETGETGEPYAAPQGPMLLARVDGKPAGCLALERIDARTCGMTHLFVRADYRRLGVASKLCRAASWLAWIRGFKATCLETGDLPVAQSFLRALGFREIRPSCEGRGDLPRHRVLMERSLAT